MKRFIPLAVALLLLLMTAGVYVFMVSAVTTNVDRMSTALSESALLSERDLSLQSTETILEEVAPLRASLGTLVIPAGEEVRAIETLEALGTDERVALSIASVVPKGGEWAHHSRIEATLSVEGTFARAIRFLAALETYPALVRVESVSLEKSGNTSWFATVGVTFIAEKL